jgi:hypothetical protein
MTKHTSLCTWICQSIIPGPCPDTRVTIRRYTCHPQIHVSTRRPPRGIDIVHAYVRTAHADMHSACTLHTRVWTCIVLLGTHHAARVVMYGSGPTFTWDEPDRYPPHPPAHQTSVPGREGLTAGREGRVTEDRERVCTYELPRRATSAGEHMPIDFEVPKSYEPKTGANPWIVGAACTALQAVRSQALPEPVGAGCCTRV